MNTLPHEAMRPLEQAGLARRMPRRPSKARWLGASVLATVLSLLAAAQAGCAAPVIDVPVAPAEDDDDGDQGSDEDVLRPCAEDSTCDARHPYCHQGFCVECFERGQCDDGERCDVDDGECELDSSG